MLGPKPSKPEKMNAIELAKELSFFKEKLVEKIDEIDRTLSSLCARERKIRDGEVDVNPSERETENNEKENVMSRARMIHVAEQLTQETVKNNKLRKRVGELEEEIQQLHEKRIFNERKYDRLAHKHKECYAKLESIVGDYGNKAKVCRDEISNIAEELETAGRDMQANADAIEEALGFFDELDNIEHLEDDEEDD